MIQIQEVIYYILLKFIIIFYFIEFTLTSQGEDVIKSFKGDFGVISVAGMYRTGKSYLINRMLLNRQKGFSVGPTINPCTKGLWVWSKPIYGDDGSGKRLPVLLIDTEGFGALDTDQNHDIRIFTLAILLSSYFLYNSVGGIDESALQNLNFVINLSKFIRLKNSDNTESSPEELANLFPSFLWVLRDFSLQLIDENDENISPKQYLEKVLEGTKQKNASDPKNKIRKLIKSYFKDRDCFTMVRPLTNEHQLQSLEDLPPEKLRHEFLEQIIALRKKVLSRIKVKTMNGKALNSEMYLNLVKGLIGALNSGNVPNIENTWLSMCKVESYKAFEEAEQLYEKILKEKCENTDEPLEDIHKEAKEAAINYFNQKALGDIAKDYLKQLKNKIKEKYSYYVKLQDEDCKGKITRVLNKWYSIIEQRIQNNEFQNLDEINKDFETLEEKLNENFPTYAGRVDLFNDFKTKVLSFAGNYFTKKAENEKKFLEEQTQQKIKKLKDDLENTRSNLNKENEKKQIIINQNKTQINDLQEELSHMKEMLAMTQKEKEQAANNFNNQLSRLKDEFERKVKQAELNSNDNEEKQKQAERRAIAIKAEYDKEKALLTQKNELLERQIDDFKQREKEIKQETNSQLKEQSIAYKDKVDKFEKTIKNLNEQNEELKEKLVDMESNLDSIGNELQNEKQKNIEISEKTEKDLRDKDNELNKFKKSAQEEKSKMQNDYINKINELNGKIKDLIIKIEELNIKYKSLEDSSRNKISKLEKDNAFLKQENSLLKSQNEDANKRMNEQKTHYENIIKNLETKVFQVDHAEFQKKIDEIKSYYEDERKKNEESWDKEKEEMENQIQKLNQNLNNEKLELKNTKDELNHLKLDTKNTINKLTKENNDMKLEKAQLNSNISKNSDLFNTKLKNQISDYEKKLEDKESLHQKEISQLNKNNEETLSQLKSLFESEKARLEDKLKEEKSKNAKKLQNLIDEYENRLKEQENEYKEENENLQNELADLNQAHEAFVSNAEHDFELMNQKVLSSEKALKEAKDSLNSESSKNKISLESLNDQISKERKELQIKIDNLTNDFNSKEKEYTALVSKKDQLEKIIYDKDILINQMRDEYGKEKDDLTRKYEELKKKNSELNDINMMKNLEYTRDSALLKQQIEYLNKKNEESAKATEANQKRYEERLFSLRQDVEKDLGEKFERLKNEKNDLENKLYTKKREMKELEQNFTKQNQMNEKEKNELNEKNELLQKKYDDLNKLYNTEKANNEKQISLLNKANDSFKTNLSTNEQKMRNRIYELETELLEKKSQYEKDQILWEGKIKFIEQQRDTLKKEQNESNKRFETMLDSIQKKSTSEKENIENNAKLSINNMEQKYQKQVKDLQDNHNKLYSELLSRNKELEKDIKSLRLENEIAKNKNFNPSDLTKRLEQINKEKENLLKNENFLKEEQDKKVNELTVGFEKEKDNYKKRISELEKNLREAEGKKGSLLLELEKEKAKWNIEKDNLVTKYSELNDKLTRVEKKNEGLLRENEKLRNEKNMLRRAGATTTGKYSLMLRDGNTLGSTILGNLGIGGKSGSNFGLSQNFKSSVLRGLDKGNQENSNNDNNNTISENFNMKEYSLGNIRINDENIQQNQDDNE